MDALLVEDDRSLADGIIDALEASAIRVRHVVRGGDALEAVAANAPDIVILDLGLPDMDGTEVARRLRAAGEVPIIVISARSEELDRVLALELGADDYLVKPFGMRELLARIRAVIRRTAGSGASAAESGDLGPLEIDERSRRVTLDGSELHLTATEFDLLRYLAADAGAVRRRPDILRDVWHTEWYGATKTLDAHVAALRRKLGAPEWIRSVRGVGFRFEVPGGSPDGGPR